MAIDNDDRTDPRFGRTDLPNVPRVLVRAHMRYNLAAAQGDPEGVENRKLVEHLMTENQISRARQMAGERQMYVP